MQMKIGFTLRWYEWIGWLVNALIIGGAAVFISISLSEEETRPALICFSASLFLVGCWSWVLLFYGKETEESSTESGGEDRGRH
ncbi:MAG: hypothetical protein PHS17_05860 [Desulfobacterales bacterium]|nr:hypothetical protein [Desulfobacterales bacterium]